LIGLAKGSH